MHMRASITDCVTSSGGFITTSYLGWRWTQYITAFMGFAACIATLIWQEESYAPVILVSKAAELRRLTKNWGIHAKQEEVEVDLKELLTKNISRPMRILFTEPIVLLITIYMSFLYGLLYLFLTAYAIVFQDIYGFSPGVGGLPYFGFITGEVIGFIVVVLMNPGYVRKLEANGGVPVPEWRLPVVMAGGISFTIGKFHRHWGVYYVSYPQERNGAEDVPNRSFLVRLDRLYEHHSLDCSNAIRTCQWLWYLHCVSPITKLHRGRLPEFLCIRISREYLHAVSLWRHISSFCHLYVQWSVQHLMAQLSDREH